jgi:hypothetical protein
LALFLLIQDTLYISRRVHHSLKEAFMRIVFKLLLALSLISLTACPAQTTTPSVGKLEVKISGLPSGTNANVSVTGPTGSGFSQTLTATKTIADLKAGAYSVTATNVTAGGKNYGASITGNPAAVTAGGSSSVGVVYAGLRTITGKLLDGSGQPITSASITSSGARLNIKLLGSTTSTTVDANGGFTLTNVPATYSLAVEVAFSSATSSGGHYATVFQGLTRANPTLTFGSGPFSNSPVLGSSSPLEGNITGGLGFPTPLGTSTVFTVAVPKAVNISGSSYFSTVNASSGSYSTGTGWAGSDPVTATLHALQFSTDINGKITAYSGYGRQSVTLTPQGTDPGQPFPTPVKQDVALAAVSVGTLKGAIKWPPGSTKPEYLVATNLLFAGSDQTNLNLSAPTGFGSQPLTVAPTGYNQLVPLITGAKFIQQLSFSEIPTPGSITQGGQSTVWKSVTPDVNTDITVPAPISLTLPDDAESGVTSSTKFSWSTYTGGVYILKFYVLATVPTFVDVVTAASSGTIPELSADFALPKASIVLWAVQGIAPYSSVDAATDAAGLILPFLNTPLADTAISNSASRKFTTAK